MSRKDRFRQSRTPARDAAERIERVVEAAERAAETVIDDAEKRAKAYLADAQTEADRVVSQRLASLSELSDTLRAQAEAIGRQAEGLLATMEQVKAVIGADDGGLPLFEGPPRERASHLTAVAEPEDPQPEPTATAGPGPGEPRRRSPSGHPDGGVRQQQRGNRAAAPKRVRDRRHDGDP